MESDDDYGEPEESENFITPNQTDQELRAEDYIFSLHVTDDLRRIFVLVVLVGNFVSVNIAIILICLAWYVKNSVEKHITFLQDFYNPQAVPAIVGLSGFIMLVASVIGVKAGIDARGMDTEEYDKTSPDFMFIYTVAAVVTFGAVLVTALTCFIEIGTLSSALGQGLLAGMENYKHEPTFKPEIDIVQINYKCCGSDSYKDWFNVSWVDTKYLATGDSLIRNSMKKNEYIGKDVPFSCCKIDVLRPCVDTRVEDSSYNSKYQYPSDLTLYTVGCKEAVSSFLGHTVFKGVGLFIFFCSMLWMALTVVSRYLNTAMSSVSVGQAPIGWLIPYIWKKKTDTFKTEESIDDDEESEEYEPES